MNPNPPSPENRPWLPKDQQRFALGLAGAAIVLGLVVLNQRSAPLDLKREVHAIEERVRARHRTNALRKVRAACKHTDCACASTAAVAGLDVEAGKEVLTLLERARTCKADATAGIGAEALVRSATGNAGVDAAQAVLRQHGEQPHALTARALAEYYRGANHEAAAFARRAIAARRGDGAQFLLGLIDYAQGQLESSRQAFSEVVKSEPDDVDALYNLALVAQQQARYGAARSQYLRVLKLNPRYKQARYNLGILAHSIGATAEAGHHLEKLKAIAPGDPLVATLEAKLATPPSNPPRVLTLGAASAPPP